MPKVTFTNADVGFRLTGKKVLAAFVENLFAAEGKKLKSLDYIFCSDEYLLEINKQFLSHDYFTDIITFDLSDRAVPGISGEVYISVDRVVENASLQRTTKQNELLRVVLHGALHLCGYKDKKKSEITIMREKEDDYLRLFGAK
jgi:probable rRNA maturation factor